jgi:hypothetical protein
VQRQDRQHGPWLGAAEGHRTTAGAHLERTEDPELHQWTTIAIGIAGGVLGVGAVAGIAARTRRAGGARATA